MERDTHGTHWILAYSADALHVRNLGRTSDSGRPRSLRARENSCCQRARLETLLVGYLVLLVGNLFRGL